MKQTYSPLVPTRSIKRERRSAKAHDIHKIFEWIIAFKSKHDGNSPSLSEIMQAFDISSKAVVSDILRRLANAGLIRRNGRRHAARMIEVIGGRWTFQTSGAER